MMCHSAVQALCTAPVQLCSWHADTICCTGSTVYTLHIPCSAQCSCSSSSIGSLILARQSWCLVREACNNDVPQRSTSVVYSTGSAVFVACRYHMLYRLHCVHTAYTMQCAV